MEQEGARTVEVSRFVLISCGGDWLDILQVLGLRFQVGRSAGFDVPQGLFFGSAGFDSQWRLRIAKTSSR